MCGHLKPNPVPAVDDDPERLLREVRPDFIDVITHPDTHAHFVETAAAHGIPVVCQKPMAPSLAEAEQMVRDCREAGVPFIVHENMRWQAPIRQVKRLLETDAEGSLKTLRLVFAAYESAASGQVVVLRR